MFLDLREIGEQCGRHRVAWIMRTHKIKAVLGYKVHRRVAERPSIAAPNWLERALTVEAPNTAWVTDITYIRTWQGWLYLAVVVDLYSRRVVGWSMKPMMEKEIVLDALRMALCQRRPSGPVIVHSDRARSTAATTCSASAAATGCGRA